MRPGETGLVALDWWNGNRSILADADLTGAIFGLTLQTTRGGDLPRAARVDRVRQPPDHGELHRARARAHRDRRLRRDRRAQPADHAAARRHERARGPRARRRARSRRAARRCSARSPAGAFAGHRRGDRRDAARDRAHLHARSRGEGRLRRGVRDLPRACTRRSGAPRSSCSTGSSASEPRDKESRP